MTINKSQGQTFSNVGVYLPVPCFAHGQLYVAMSRVGSPEAIHFLVTHEQPKNATPGQIYTQNVVFIEELDAQSS